MDLVLTRGGRGHKYRDFSRRHIYMPLPIALLYAQWTAGQRTRKRCVLDNGKFTDVTAVWEAAWGAAAAPQRPEWRSAAS